jgi:hypothetical protein
MRRPALVAAALLVLVALPSPAAADPPPPAYGDDTAPPEVVDGDTSGLGFGGGEVAGAGAAAVDTDGISPNGSFGFLPLGNTTTAQNFGAYRLQIATQSTSNINPESLRADLQSVADELTNITRVQFTVDPGTVDCTGCVAGPGGSNFRPNEPTVSGNRLVAANVGLIRVRMADTSPCPDAQNGHTLVPFNQSTGVVGCANWSSVGSPPLLVRGSVWLSPSLFNAATNSSIRRATLAHEIGHALGLDHFSGNYPSVGSNLQLMYPSVHRQASDVPGAPVDGYHLGDRNGLWYMANDFGWYLAATYGDFLERRPSTNEYRLWFLGDATLEQYLVFLTTSDEWVGKIVDDFYLDILGRPNTDPVARTFWMNRVRQVGVPQTASDMYAQPEYFDRVRNDVPGYVRSTNDGFVRALYHDLLGREADTAGRQFWVSRLDSQALTRQAVAIGFYQSIEKRLLRVRDLYCTVLDRGPEGDADDPPGAPDDGWTFWARQILVDGDLSLARSLAASQEYLSRDDDMALRPLAGPADLPAPCTGF